MHTSRIYITILSVLSIVVSSSSAIAQNIATTSISNGIEISQNEEKADDPSTVPGGSRYSSLQTKEHDIKDGNQQRGSGRVSTN